MEISQNAAAAVDSSRSLSSGGDEDTLYSPTGSRLPSQAGLQLSNDQKEAITYLYLTFETPLPPLVTERLSSPLQDGSTALELPDADRYRSPLTWSSRRKSTVIFLACLTSIFVCYAAGSYNAASTQLQSQFGVSRTVSYLGITSFTVGFAIAPMILAPFSEINGRKPVFIATGLLFWVCQLCCAVSQSFAGLMVARFFVGVGGSTFSSTVGGVIGDIYAKDERNTPMALLSGLALFGTGLGPLCSGFLAQRLDWRWVFWIQTITCGACVLAVIVGFEETRGNVILRRKAQELNKWYEAREALGIVNAAVPTSKDEPNAEIRRIRWKVESDEERENLMKMIRISLYRPFYLLFTEPVVFVFSLWVSVAQGILYLTFSVVPLVYTTNHGFNLEQNGAVFAAMCIGSIIQTAISIYQERVIGRFGKVSTTPDGRLYFSCVQSGLLPIGLFWFGWTLGPSIHWIVPTIAIGVLTMGLISIYLAVFNYLADTYRGIASSALAAQSFCRNMLAGVFPLIADAMFERMTFSGASSFLGGMSLLLTLVPWVLVFYGPRIRARSKIAKEFLQQQTSEADKGEKT